MSYVGNAATDQLVNATDLDPNFVTPVVNGGTGVTTTANTVAGKLKSATTDVSVSGATAPSNGQVLMATSSTTATWQTPAPATASAVAPTIVVVSGPTQTTAVNNHYVLTNAAATTVTLHTPAAGDIVWVTVANGRVDNVLNVTTNSQSVNGDATNMTIDSAYATLQLRYIDATSKWRIM
jgi:hypothetical protein